MTIHSVRGDPQRLREEFDALGFAVVGDAIDEALLAQVQRETEQIVGAQLERLGRAPRGAGRLFDDLAALHDADLESYLQSLRLAAKLASVFALYLAPPVRRLMQALGIQTAAWQTSPVLHVMAERLRIPGGYYGVDTHQDWPALQSGLDTVTGWIPLFDVTEDTFPLEVAPGSHLLGLLPGRPSQHYYAIDPAALAGLEFTGLAVPRGGIALMSNFTVHRSGLRGGDALRMAYSHRYENAAEPSFVARRYPSAQSRSIRRELMQPGFPGREEVQRVYRRRS